MKDAFKARLFKILGLKRYLQLLQAIFITAYRTGLLRSNEKYKWHYFVKKIINPSDTIIDIGANLGYFSIIFADIINDKGHLFSVEPVKPYLDLLVKALPKKPNITVCPFALGDKNEGPVKLGMPPLLQHLQYLKHGTVTILDEEKISEEQLIFESEIKKASEVFAGLSSIDYIKCDIEGYETVVFPELKQLIIQHQPMVQLETWGEQVPPMMAFFKELGYESYHLEENKLVDCSAMSVNEIGASDILFVPAGKINQLKKYMD